MKLKSIFLGILFLNILFLSACSFDLNPVDGTTYTPIHPSTYKYNYFYKNALYDFTFEFKENNLINITVVDQSIPQSSGEKRESTMSGDYSISGKVLTLQLKAVTDDLNLINSESQDKEPFDLIFQDDEDGNLTLIHINSLFPILPSEITMWPANTTTS